VLKRHGADHHERRNCAGNEAEGENDLFHG
jgi:hypothetical protein